GHKGYECVADKVACTEVRLAHAGHEFVQGGAFRQEGSWRYANPYVRMAEDTLIRAEREADACSPPPVVAAAPVVERRVVTEVAEVPLIVLFNFDKHTEADIRSFTRATLDRTIARIKSGELRPTSIEVIGHADRLGDDAYNLNLASRRAATVSNVLTRAGIDPAIIRAGSKGDNDQVEACRGKFASQAEERECLLPNRRVEVRVISAATVSK
ncbi:MAG: OmpA family protein, partial [Burkholderiaceae bacterium]